MQLNEKIVETLQGLDHSDNAIWTSTGEVRVEIVSKLVGETLTRAHIRDAAPDFVRNYGDAALEEVSPEVTALQRLQEQAESRQRRLDAIARITGRLQEELAGVRAVRAEIKQREAAIQKHMDELSHEAQTLRSQESHAYRVRRHNQQAMQEIRDRFEQAKEKGLPMEAALAPCDQIRHKPY